MLTLKLGQPIRLVIMLTCCYDSVEEDTYKYHPVKCLMLDHLSDADFPPLVFSYKSLPEGFSIECSKKKLLITINNSLLE